MGSFIFGALGVNRFMTGQIWLGVLKLALFLAHMILFIVITSATLDAVANASTNEDLQNAFKLIGVNTFIAGILGIVITIWWFVDLFITSSAVRKQNLEKFKIQQASKPKYHFASQYKFNPAYIKSA